jgi:hypothetical protein
MDPLSGQDTFVWGAVGALLGLVVVSLLPLGYALSSGSQTLVINGSRVVGWAIVVIGLIAVGGFAALGVGNAADASQPTEPIHAIAYGLGWQSTLGALAKGT